MVASVGFIPNPQAVLLLAACRTPKPDRLLGNLKSGTSALAGANDPTFLIHLKNPRGSVY